jgi:hypothetical protein
VSRHACWRSPPVQALNTARRKTNGRPGNPVIGAEGRIQRAVLASRNNQMAAAVAQLVKINSGPEDADEKARDEDAQDQPEGAERNSALAHALIGGVPGYDGRQK